MQLRTHEVSVSATEEKLIYPNASQDPELARLCISYQMPTAFFNACLEFKKFRSEYDKLPSILIDGKRDAGKPGYYLLKLHALDPQIFLLPEMICSSRSSDIHPTIKAGLINRHIGFYVLLKEKESAATETATPSRETLLKTCHIIGYGRAGLTEENNIIIESWHNRDSADYIISTLMLRHLAKKITEQSTVLRITIGDKNFQHGEFLDCVTNPERMPGSRDTEKPPRQFLIYSNTDHIKELQTDLIQLFNKFYPEEKNPEQQEEREQIKLFILPAEIISIKRAEKIKFLLQQLSANGYFAHPEKRTQLTKLFFYEKLRSDLQEKQSNILDVLLFEFRKGGAAQLNLAITTFVTTYEKHKNTFFDLVVLHQHPGLRQLLRYNPDVNYIPDETRSTMTPLFYSVEVGNERMVELLVNAKAGIDLTDQTGRTPLNRACELDSTRIVVRLLQAKANASIADQHGATPLSHALKHENASIVRLLLDSKKSMPDELDEKSYIFLQKIDDEMQKKYQPITAHHLAWLRKQIDNILAMDKKPFSSGIKELQLKLAERCAENTTSTTKFALIVELLLELVNSNAKLISVHGKQTDDPHGAAICALLKIINTHLARIPHKLPDCYQSPVEIHFDPVYVATVPVRFHRIAPKKSDEKPKMHFAGGLGLN